MIKTFYSIFILILLLFLLTGIFFLLKIKFSYGFGYTSSTALLVALKRAIVLSFFTILGILFRLFYDDLKNIKREKIRITNVIRRSINTRATWMAIIISPVIIITFFKSLESISSDALVALIAYQNGFFFRSILGRE